MELVYVYFIDNRQHKCPHIRAKYQEYKVSVGIPDGDILEGELLSSKMKLLQAWIEIHRDELMAAWFLAVEGEQPPKIEPLRRR